MACDFDVEVSIRATSGKSFRCGSEYWTGNEIELLQNDNLVGIFPAGFEDFQICIVRDQVDIENDYSNCVTLEPMGYVFSRRF